MDRFSKFHPLVCLLFFLFTIAVTLFFINPVYTIASFLCSILYSLRLVGVRRTAAQLKFSLPLILIAAAFNMIFCRYGQTVLFSVFSIDFSLEPFVYGACLGTMLAAVIIWFSAYSEIITSEKFTAVFGKFAPNTVLIFSMVLRFLPLMLKTAGEIKEAQQGLGNETKGVKNTLRRFSALVSVSLERSIETADTMRARGFKNGRRHYSPYRFTASDGIFIFIFLVLFVFQIAACAAGKFSFEYYDHLRLSNISVLSVSLWVLMCALPLITDLSEDIKWQFLKSKI